MIGSNKELRVVFVEGNDALAAQAQTDVLNAHAKDGWAFAGFATATEVVPVRASGPGYSPSHDNDPVVAAASRTTGAFIYFERTRMPSPETVLASEAAPGSKMSRAMRRHKR